MFYDIPEGRTKAGVCINFDDTTRSDTWLAFHNTYGVPLYNWKATYCCDVISPGARTLDVQRLVASGHEVANHGEINHPGINKIPHDTPAQFVTAMETCTTFCETNFGQTPIVYAWQIGYYNPDYIEYALANSNYLRFRHYGTIPAQAPYAHPSIMMTAVFDAGNIVDFATTLLPLLEYARDNNKVLMGYGHSVLASILNPPPSYQTLLTSDLQAICQFVIDNDMAFYTMSELVPERAIPPIADPLATYVDDLFMWISSQRSNKQYTTGTSDVRLEKDLSNTGADLQQLTAGPQPSIVGRPLNNKYVVRYQGTSDFQVSTLPASEFTFLHNGSISYTVAMVISITATTANQRVIRTMASAVGTGIFVDYIHSTTTLRFVIGNGSATVALLSESSFPHNTYCKVLVGYNADLDRYEMAVQDLPLVTGTPTASESGAAPNTTFEFAGKSAAGANFLGGDRAEIMIVKNIAPVDARAYVDNWDNQEWAV